MSTFTEEKSAELVSRREQLITQFGETARAPGEPELSPIVRDIVVVREFIETLARIASEQSPRRKSSVPRFIVSALLLHEEFKRLTADKDEQFVFVTGTEVDEVMVLDQVVEVEHDRRSPGGVTANHSFTHKLLIKLEEFGHRLLATFHSHPGRGPGGTLPSSIDVAFQQRLESAGHQAVMAIFSRDGFIRFLRNDNNFEISIWGKGVIQHEKHLFQLTDIG